MSEAINSIRNRIEQQNRDFEDAGIRPDQAQNFLTVLANQQDLELPFRLASTQAANQFLQSYHTSHSEALQHVRADELLVAMHDDLHQSKLNLTDVYREEVKLLKAGQLDEEDAAMTETLGRRIGKVASSILKLAEMRENSDNSFEKIKAAADMAKQLDKGPKTSKGTGFLSV